MPNPLIDQGQLNRVIANIVVPSNAQLNINAGFLGKMGIRLALEGNATDYIDTMTGSVASPAPYMRATITAHLLKSQILSSLYKAQMEVASRIGDIAVFPDVQLGQGLPVYQFINCSIQSIPSMTFDGMDPDWAVNLMGYYNINASLWG